jgi:hypothetical protein
MYVSYGHYMNPVFCKKESLILCGLIETENLFPWYHLGLCLCYYLGRFPHTIPVKCQASWSALTYYYRSGFCFSEHHGIMAADPSFTWRGFAPVTVDSQATLAFVTERA